MPVSAQQKERYSQLTKQSVATIHRSYQVSIEDELKCLSNYAQPEDSRDVYGRGGIAKAFEADVARLFGKPDALFLPTGTLAQNVAMKCYSENTSRHAVALHPTSHLLLHEHNAIETLWGLRVKTVGRPDTVVVSADLDKLDATDICALIIETPMRELGGVMPDWETLVSIRHWCDANQVALHMDGARVWQTTVFYQRNLQEIARLFDSLYVSFYKDLNGISGAALLADSWLIDDARVWARRAGGNPVSLYPEVLAARYGLEKFGDKMTGFISYANTLGRQLAHADFIVCPQTVQAAMFHLKIPSESQNIAEKILEYAARTGIVVLPLPRSETDNYCICEISIGDQAVRHPPEFWVGHIAACLHD